MPMPPGANTWCACCRDGKRKHWWRMLPLPNKSPARDSHSGCEPQTQLDLLVIGSSWPGDILSQSRCLSIRQKPATAYDSSDQGTKKSILSDNQCRRGKVAAHRMRPRSSNAAFVTKSRFLSSLSCHRDWRVFNESKKECAHCPCRDHVLHCTVSDVLFVGIRCGSCPS